MHRMHTHREVRRFSRNYQPGVLAKASVDTTDCLRTRTPRCFTLIELLIVVAILCLLASLLMPHLTRAVESSRRIVCMSNMRQIYASFVVYTEDHSGQMPYGPGIWTQPNLSTAPFYWEMDQQPLLMFLQNYLGMRIFQRSLAGPHVITEPKGKEVYFCPSYGNWVKTSSDTYWTGTRVFGDEFAYVFGGAGRYWAPPNYYPYMKCHLRNFGAPRLDRMGGSLGPVAFLVERFGEYAIGGNHKWAGSTVFSEKGEGRWVDVSRLGGVGGFYMSWPLDYYRSTSVDWTATCGGQCNPDAHNNFDTLRPGDTAVEPWGYQPQYRQERRAIYGYAPR